MRTISTKITDACVCNHGSFVVSQTCCPNFSVYIFNFNWFLPQPLSCSSWLTSTGPRPSRRRSRGCWLVLSRRLLEREMPQQRGLPLSVQVSLIEQSPVFVKLHSLVKMYYKFKTCAGLVGSSVLCISGVLLEL